MVIFAQNKEDKMNNTKTRSRRKFTAEFKAKVAMEALQEKLTLTELSKKYDVHPNLVTKWKNQLLEHGSSVIKDSKEETESDKDKLIAELYKTIGSLTMDVEFLKKALAMTREERMAMVSKEDYSASQCLNHRNTWLRWFCFKFKCHRFLNAVEPGADIPIHHHPEKRSRLLFFAAE